MSVPQGVPVERSRARERKGDDKSGRSRRIEKVAPVGPGNGIPVLDSAGNPRHYRVTKRRSAGTIVRAITTGDIEKTRRIYRILTRCVSVRKYFRSIFLYCAVSSNADPRRMTCCSDICFITQEITMLQFISPF